MFLFKFSTADVAYFAKGIYIPICLYLNSLRFYGIFCHVFIYIPICLYLNHFLPFLILQSVLYLHSNMSLFKLQRKDARVRISLIYIPICLYLNSVFPISTDNNTYLHSNMSLFKCIPVSKIGCITNIFTFQYVSI